MHAPDKLLAAPADPFPRDPARAESIIADSIRAARDLLGMDLAYIADMRQGLQDYTQLAGDGTSFGIAVGEPVGLEGTYCALMLSGALDGIVGDARSDHRVDTVAFTRSADVGSYLGVPIRLPDGEVYGSFCCVSHEANTALGGKDLGFMRVVARLIGAQLHRDELEQRRGADLRGAAQRERVAFEEAPIGSIVLKRDGTIERVNRALCGILGYTAGELVGMQIMAVTHPEDLGHSAALIAHPLGACTGTGTQRYAKRYLHRTGRVINARIALTPILDEADEVTQFFAQLEDVTDALRVSSELKAAQFEMLARLAAAAEFHDDDTSEHTRRVAEMSFTIARLLGLPAEQTELIRLAAPLHDVGKIAIPDALLGKRGKLTAAEFEQMQRHTTVGAQMLTAGAFDLLAMAEQIALTHHERWDGSGYPAGLAGEAIPIAGRIVAVADVFDALTHARPYKPAWSTAEAIAEMESQSGRHFDPAVLDAFLRMIAAAPPAGGVA